MRSKSVAIVGVLLLLRRLLLILLLSHALRLLPTGAHHIVIGGSVVMRASDGIIVDIIRRLFSIRSRNLEVLSILLALV